MQTLREDLSHYKVRDLVTETIAAEINLTHFASRHGKESPVYKDCLRDFATAWYLLKKHRRNEEFHREVSAS